MSPRRRFLLVTLRRLHAWLQDGYPTSVDRRDRFPLVALAPSHRLTAGEVAAVAASVPAHCGLDRIEIGAAIARQTHHLPHPDDISRVSKWMREHRSGDSS